MLKWTLFSTLVLFFSISAQATPGFEGEQYLKLWHGQYQVIQCLQCADIKTDHTNLKYFLSLSVYSHPIPADQKLGCAQVDTSLSWGPDFKNPDGSSEGIVETSGQCDWGFDEFLKVTPDSYEYRTTGQNPGHQSVLLLVKKQADGTYLVDLKVERKTQAWGFPLSYELKAITKKTN